MTLASRACAAGLAAGLLIAAWLPAQGAAAEMLAQDGGSGTATGTQRWSPHRESLGALVATVDGRDVPLTIGYHKVSVEIRDQIARTTIEESFVNHVAAALEGEFYFPLPQDASIAGFGMWIGDRLVEADVVEKQRARAIFETFLSRRLDPGLLEWTGGNLFKARVFPIPGKSEKRITITYTQFLPLRDGVYRYQYGLQSEMLKQNPLRQLEIDVKVSSTVPLRNAASPSHATRNSLAPHAARVEFSAKDYVPAGDFEVVIEPARQQSVITVIPHRSGDDGYFMLQLAVTGSKDSPPASRQVVPTSEPLDLRIIADTSASMDAANRKRQGEFVAAVLAALTEKDTFNLATADVDCSWVFTAAKPADAKAAETARQFLAARTSLGWTDLDRTFASALKQCGPKTQVIYVGDGIVTAGDGDPAALAKRLRRMADERTHHAPRDAGASQGPHAEREEYGTFHAVATGNSFEPTVLRAIAAIGGGSMRQINASGPKAAALDLLHEIVEPGLRDVKVEFRGLRTARVYPDPLPNLATGTQQIILGRYRPEGKEQTGEVIVTGTQDGKPVRFTATVTLPSAAAGEGYLGGPQGKTDCQSVLRTEGTLLPSGAAGEGTLLSAPSGSVARAEGTLLPSPSGRGAGGEGSSFIPRL